MALVDYSLERFPEHLIESLDDLEFADQVNVDLPDLLAEEQAHRINVTIAEWIEQLAASASGSHSHFMPDHTYVGLHEVQLDGDVQTDRYEVGFFRRVDPQELLVPPEPFITLYSWRVEQLGFGIVWSSLGFRCGEIAPEAEEHIYSQVVSAATAHTTCRERPV